jgi:hypothetical protein
MRTDHMSVAIGLPNFFLYENIRNGFYSRMPFYRQYQQRANG